MEKQTIDIGTKINLADLLTSRMLIQANSGGGKSALARTIIEETYGNVPFIIIDYDGEYYTLKEQFDDILVIGGQYADVPLSMKSVKLLPKEIIGNQLSVIIDISDLKSNERIMYVKHFLETMMELPKQYWMAYFVFLEEAHKLCGEQDKQESASAVKDLMSRGRKMGYCGVLITQRIAKLHKDAAAECNNKFIGRTNLDLDMDRAAKELGFSASSQYTRLSLRDLQPGNFYAYGTSIEPHHVHEVTINLPKTKMVKAGHNIDIKPKKPTAKLLSMLTKLNDLPQEAEKEMKNIVDLQKEVNRLKHELSKATKPGVSLQVSKNVNQNSKLEETNRQLQIRNGELVAQIKQKEIEIKDWKRLAINRAVHINKIDRIIDESLKLTDPDHTFMTILKEPTILDDPRKPEDKYTPKDFSNFKRMMPKERMNGSDTIGKCSREIIRFLAQYKDRNFSKEQVAIATNYSPGSGGFNNAISELSQKEFLFRANGRLQVNDDAMSDITSSVGEITHKEYNIETYKNNLGKCEREIYEKLLEAPQYWFKKEEMASETGYSVGSGGFNNAISRLNTLALIEKRTGEIRLNQELLELI